MLGSSRVYYYLRVGLGPCRVWGHIGLSLIEKNKVVLFLWAVRLLSWAMLLGWFD